MADILRIFTLTIASSYSRNKEVSSPKTCDTLQFYAHNKQIWRIRTYALDHDIHIHQINMNNRSIEEVLTFLSDSTKEHYGDVVAHEYTLQLESTTDKKSAETFLAEHGLHPKLESTTDYAFWNPDGGTYRSQTNPLS